jgi:hypothetical protein
MAKRYHRGNHKPSTEEQTIQWPQDIKEVILVAIALPVLQWTASDYPYGIV